MAWMETDYSKHMHFQWKIKWRMEHLGALEIMGEKAPLKRTCWGQLICYCTNEEKMRGRVNEIGNTKSRVLLGEVW